MNDQNLINPASRLPGERKKLASKAAKKKHEVEKQKKEEKEKRQSLAQILENIVFAEAKTPLAVKVLEITGSKDTNYFAALAAATIVKSIKKGDANAMAKIMELLGEKPSDKLEVTSTDATVLELQKYLSDKKQKGKKNK